MKNTAWNFRYVINGDMFIFRRDFDIGKVQKKTCGEMHKKLSVEHIV